MRQTFERGANGHIQTLTSPWTAIVWRIDLSSFNNYCSLFAGKCPDSVLYRIVWRWYDIFCTSLVSTSIRAVQVDHFSLIFTDPNNGKLAMSARSDIDTFVQYVRLPYPLRWKSRLKPEIQTIVSGKLKDFLNIIFHESNHIMCLLHGKRKEGKWNQEEDKASRALNRRNDENRRLVLVT